MRKHFLWVICALLLLTVTVISGSLANKVDHVSVIKPSEDHSTSATSAKMLFTHYVDEIYNSANLAQSGLDSVVFKKAIIGYYNLKMASLLPVSSTVITVVDFCKPSVTKRMWIIDLQNKKLLLNTWVAHGQGSGDNMANAFSNRAESHQSSLGFYVTNEVYFGKHGRSLRLDGMDEGFNDRARSRDIVLHGAEYVNQNTINQLGRLGRSFGCPAVSVDVVDDVINTVKNKNLLFINGNDNSYTSKYLNEEIAANAAFTNTGNNLAKESFD